MRKLEGKVVGSQMKMGIVAARFNELSYPSWCLERRMHWCVTV